MTRSKKNKKSVIIAGPSSAMIRTPNTAPVVVVSSSQQKKKKKKRRSKRGRIGLTIVGEVERAWLASLNNPFENVPLPIGIGNMYPSEIASCYIRGGFNSNADSSFQIWLSPGQWMMSSAANGSFVAIDNLAAGTTPTFAAGANAAQNTTAIQGAFDQFRVLSAGIRIINGGSWSGNAGIIASCVFPQDASGAFHNGTANTPVTVAALVNYPQMDWTRSYDPLQVCWRPTELIQFGQYLSTAGPFGSNAVGMAPTCVVVGNGGQGSAPIFYEAIAHIECYNVSKGIIGGSSIHMPRATASAETMGGVYQSIMDFLEPASQSVIEWSKEAAHTLGQSALAGGLAYAQKRLFRSRGHGFMGGSPYDMIELKSDL